MDQKDDYDDDPTQNMLKSCLHNSPTRTCPVHFHNPDQYLECIALKTDDGLYLVDATLSDIMYEG